MLDADIVDPDTQCRAILGSVFAVTTDKDKQRLDKMYDEQLTRYQIFQKHGMCADNVAAGTK